MPRKRTIPLVLVVLVAVLALGLVGAGLFFGERDELFGLLSSKKSNDPSDQRPRGMELQGDWQGLSLADSDSLSGRQLGATGGTPGVMVVGLSPWRAPAGLGGDVAQGDLIVGVQGQRVQNLAELYQVAQKQTGPGSLSLQVMRQGQPLQLTIPTASAPIAGEMERPGGALPVAWPSPTTYVCPRDGTVIPAQLAAGAPLACPRCQGALQHYPQQPMRRW